MFSIVKKCSYVDNANIDFIMAQLELLDASQSQNINKGQEITAPVTVLGLVNGMIGGTCLVLPQLGVTTGWITTIWVAFIAGFISYYTARLIVTHLGKGKQIRDCVMAHFQNDYRYMRAYSFFMWFSFIPLLIIYFRIICLQIEGLMGFQSVWVGPGVAIFLTAVILYIRFVNIGEEILGYGIISIISYLIFLLWAQLTAPPGPHTVPASGSPVLLASTLMMAYSIHDFMVQNIIKNPKREQYIPIVNGTFVIGTLAYTYITMGAFAIVNRHPYTSNPQIITDYFTNGQWQMVVIEIVYMGHMITAYPNFLIVSKIRFFQMFKMEVSKKMSIKEAIYIMCFILVSYVVYASGVHLQVLISINGAVVGYIYVIIIPIWIHLKCVWYDKSSGAIEGDEESKKVIEQNFCQCENTYRNKFTKYLQTVFLILAMLLGFTLMVFTLMTL